MRKLILVFYALTLWTSTFSQQDRQVSHYMYDHISVNPGSAGSSDMISTHVILRQQWVGIDGAPTSYIGNISAPFKLGNTHHGLGLAIWQDELGFNMDIDLTASYAYQFSVGNGNLGLGISGSAVNRKIKAEWDVNDMNDGGLPDEEQNEWTMDLGLGLFYQADELYVGLSSTHLLQSEYSYQPITTGSGSESKEKLVRNYYLTAGYTLPLANPALEFLPSVFINSDLAVTKIDLNATLMYNKKFWGGVTYRVGSAVVGMIGVNILNGLNVGYSYDFDTSTLSSFSKGSHEVMVGYNFRVGIEKIPQKYKSIRYL